MSIAQHHKICSKLFQCLCSVARGAGKIQDCDPVDFLDEFDKYKLWSGNVGARHTGQYYELSLDYRLREASFFKDQVLRLLEILQRRLDKATHLLNGSRVPFEDCVSVSDAGGDESSRLPAISENMSQDDESLWELSSDTSSSVSCRSADQSESRKNSRKSATLLRFPKDPSDAANQGELFQVLEGIKNTITALYRLPIRRPAPIDRLRGRSADETAHFQYFDISYVRDKFPLLDGQVSKRLGAMITKRRQLLMYRRAHQDALKAPRVAAHSKDDPFSAITPQKSPIAGVQAVAQPIPNVIIQHPPSQRESGRSTRRTKATTAVEQAVGLFVPSIPESRFMSRTSVAASQLTKSIHIKVPPRPRNQDGLGMTRFQCNYCQLTPHIRSNIRWKHHVLDDLQPYVCTFGACDLSNQFFRDRESWYAHEMQNHRVEFYCNTPGHARYKAQSQFEHHMNSEHQIDLQMSPALLKAFKIPSKVLKGTCNLCFQPTGNLKIHVSRHLQEIAIFAIPREDFATGDDEDNSQEATGDAKGSKGENARNDESTESNAPSSASPSWEDLVINVPIVPMDCNTDMIPQHDDYEVVVDTPSPNGGAEDGVETNWDIVTDKFSQARAGVSRMPPMHSQMMSHPAKFKMGEKVWIQRPATLYKNGPFLVMKQRFEHAGWVYDLEGAEQLRPRDRVVTEVPEDRLNNDGDQLFSSVVKRVYHPPYKPPQKSSTWMKFGLR